MTISSANYSKIKIYIKIENQAINKHNAASNTMVKDSQLESASKLFFFSTS